MINNSLPMFPCFSQTVQRVALVRHFESVKNVNSIHGGSGDTLTEHGKTQLAIIDDKLATFFIDANSLRIYHSDSIQTSETAKLIAETHNVTLIESPFLKSVYLGRLNGLSDSEAQKEFSNEYNIMCQWRNRKIEIESLTAIGMEHPMKFWNRGVEFIGSLSSSNNLVICSTSVMIMLIHMLCRRTYLRGNGYYHIPINNAQIVSFNIVEGVAMLDKEVTDEGMLEYC